MPGLIFSIVVTHRRCAQQDIVEPEWTIDGHADKYPYAAKDERSGHPKRRRDDNPCRMIGIRDDSERSILPGWKR